MKKTIFFLVLQICITVLFAQKNVSYNFGRISQADFDLAVYKKDSTANAVFIYEHGKTTFHDTDDQIIIRTKYYAKVKIFNKQENLLTPCVE